MLPTPMKLLRLLGVVVVLLAAVVAVVAFVARYHDGPIVVFPGGPFQTGSIVEDPAADLSFAGAVREIELQSGQPPTSRTTWILVEDGEAYVPCSLSFPPRKSWHRNALIHPNAEVRIEGKRYRRRLEKVEDEALHAKLMQDVAEKYGGGPDTDPDKVWFFHLAPGA